MGDPDPEVLPALLSWRTDMLRFGVPVDELPLVVDLELLAAAPTVSLAGLDALPLDRPELVKEWAPGLFKARSSARRAADQPGAESRKAGPGEGPRAAPGPGALGGPAGPATLGSLAGPAGPGGPGNPADPVAPAPRPVGADDGTRSEASRRHTRHRPDPTGRRGQDEPDPALSADGFAPYDLSKAVPTEVPPPRSAPSQEGLRLGWDAVPSRTVLYRIVSRDDVDVWSPDDADLVAVTRDPQAVDPRPPSTAARFYAVWAHGGDDEASARRAQPQLVARGPVVAPPLEVQLAEDHGTVYVSWAVARGVQRVEVLRIPEEESYRSGYVPHLRVGEVRERTTFVDAACTPGQEYEYRLFAVWVDPQTGVEHLSGPAGSRLRVKAVLTPVRDVEVAERVVGDLTLIDLAWDQPPRHDVVVYRTHVAPVANAGAADLDVTALPAAGLPVDQRVRAQPDVLGGRARLSGVPWPRDWPRVHFTLVTVSGTTARVGVTATRSRTGAIEHVRLVQRVDWQLLTFSWPPGAVSVAVHRTPRGTSLHDHPGELLAQLSRADYRRDGGARLQLPAEGCELHLVPKSYFERRPVPAQPTTESYAGLYRMRYVLTRPDVPSPQRRLGGRGASTGPTPPATWREVHVVGESARAPEGQVAFVLVGREDRLPLSISDAAFEVARSERGPLPDASSWRRVLSVDLARFPGCQFRLFAVADGLPVALLDPDPASLRP